MIGLFRYGWLAWRLLDVKVRTSYMGKNKSNSDGLRDIKRRKKEMVACKKGGKEREAAGKSQITKPCSRSRCPFPVHALRSALEKTLHSYCPFPIRALRYATLEKTLHSCSTALAGPLWM